MKLPRFKFFDSLKSLNSYQQKKSYFCEEPWTGILDIRTNSDVVFCPCYLKMKIGNLTETSMLETRNSYQLVQLRKSFEKGKLPKVCQGQLCPVVLGEGYVLKKKQAPFIEY